MCQVANGVAVWMFVGCVYDVVVILERPSTEYNGQCACCINSAIHRTLCVLQVDGRSCEQGSGVNV